MKTAAERLQEADDALAEANEAIALARSQERDAAKSHDPARWENRTEVEAAAERRRDAKNLEGALQTKAIREGAARELRRRRAAPAYRAPEEAPPELYSWRPSRPWHFYELIRTVAAATQVLVGLAILLKVYGAV